MTEIRAALCGRTKSLSGKPFTEYGLHQHELSCQKCREIIRTKRFPRGKPETAEDLGLGLADLIAGDESDGVYWGIAHELDEGY